ncbi:hypothetical protein [Acinetobacter baumannii]|uniref:hypothetical protein n=1 Tax=Acinetobacter baumannii TaxID=470 RepID=UPI001CDB4F6B|nr:hypothetical protein [Acinetobacter baumannii]MCA4383405.1 hypothetical protein [Acinetobacter baumannii]
MDNYKIGDEVELLEDFYTRSGAEIIFKKGTIAKVIELQLYDEIHIDVNGDNRWCSPDILKLVDKKDPALISGADVPALIKKGESVQFRSVFNVQGGGEWEDLDLERDEEEFSLGDLINTRFEWRLKPQTIKVELELPKPFEPKDGEVYYYLKPSNAWGFGCGEWGDDSMQNEYIQYGAWPTKEDVLKVVEQLRKIRGTNS